jgi:hypothetical protein
VLHIHSRLQTAGAKESGLQPRVCFSLTSRKRTFPAIMFSDVSSLEIVGEKATHITSWQSRHSAEDRGRPGIGVLDLESRPQIAILRPNNARNRQSESKLSGIVV